MEMDLNSSNFATETSSGLVLIDFWAPWCGPCRSVAPTVSEIAHERGDSLKVCRVNIDEEPVLASQARVMSIPTLVVMRDGKEAGRLVGAHPKENIDELIDRA